MKTGMYVRCSIEIEYPEKPRRFAIGKVIREDALLHEVEISFLIPGTDNLMYDLYQVPKLEKYPTDSVSHIKILPHTQFKLLRSYQEGKILAFSHTDKHGFHHYFVKMEGSTEIESLSEANMTVPLNRGDVDVLGSFLHFEFHNPKWYLHRQIVVDSLHTLKNATFGFETLIGSRVFLMSHQVDTIVRAISENPCRFMLADEVGLGKTIEAAVIMKGLQQRFGDIRILLVVPESLLYQWRNEMSYKFWTEFTVYGGGEDAEDAGLLLFPLEKIHTDTGREILKQSWDICIIDETHRLLNLEREYELLYEFSKKVTHLLLLTATPIQSRKEEFLKLVRLLDPDKYGKMSEAQFGALVEKQEFLRRKVHAMIQDLPYYIEDELADGFEGDLQSIAEVLDDRHFADIVNGIDIESNDQGLGQVKLALAYLGEHYQIERKIIRHRRKEIESSLGQRVLETVSYEMKGADEQVFENDVYEILLRYLEHVQERGMHSSTGEYLRLFLSAVFSSPWALKSLIDARKKVIQGKGGDVSYSAITDLPVRKQELDHLENVTALVSKWEHSVLKELEQVDKCFDDPDMIQGRLMKAIDHILSETMDDEKVVVFSSWKESILPLEKVLRERLGADAVRSFHQGMTEKELQAAVDDFQNDANCRVMLCDRLGGEGRNFQMANRIIHLDLPWNPSDLEQRIGRLDRIGRSGDVLSVVIHTETTLEEKLFEVWRDGLRIFEESLSGIEIAIQDIQQEITNALFADLRFGLHGITDKMKDSLDKMRERVQEERSFDMARQLDRHVQEQLMSLIQRFDSDGGNQLARTMMEWSKMTGLHGRTEESNVVIFDPTHTSIKSMVNTLYMQEDNKELLRRAGRFGEVRGTFIREVAVAREKLSFYAPGNSMFDSIVNNAYETDLGRSTAIELQNADFDWEGIVYTWSVNLDPTALLKLNEPLEHLANAQGYVPLEHFVSAEAVQPDQEAMSEDIVRVLNHSSRYRLVHLGKRGDMKINQFNEEYPSDIWAAIVERTYEQSQRKFREIVTKRIEIERAKNDFNRKINGMKAANLYFGQERYTSDQIQRYTRIYDALLEGLKLPEIRLESAAYVRLVKSDEPKL